jgi:hypothetical protein
MTDFGWSLPSVRERARECQRVEVINGSPVLLVFALLIGAALGCVCGVWIKG